MTAVGDILGGKYKLLHLLGEGGMGQVFEAVNQNTDRRVAIKTLHTQFAGDAAVVQRFLREARAATKILHPNVVDILDLDLDAATGAPYIVQEFLAGESLEAYVEGKADQRLPVEETLRILVPVMEALVAAHTIGIVHRDLKPANLFLTNDRAGAPTPKVIDFGIAKLMEAQTDKLHQTATGTLVGTPIYMSPEQAAGASDIDAGTDIWSLGVVFYELLSSALPYEAPNYNLLVAKLLYEEPSPLLLRDPSLPIDVAAVVERALQKNRSARFPSMQSMLDATVACAAWTPAPLFRLSAPPVQPSSLSAPPSPPTVDRPAVTTMTSSPSLVSGSVQPAPRPRRAVPFALLALAVVLGLAGFVALHRPPSSTAANAVHRAPVPTLLSTPPTPPEAPAVVAPVADPVIVAVPPVTPAPPVVPVVTPTARVHHHHRHHPGHDFDRGYPE